MRALYEQKEFGPMCCQFKETKPAEVKEKCMETIEKEEIKKHENDVSGVDLGVLQRRQKTCKTKAEVGDCNLFGDAELIVDKEGHKEFSGVICRRAGKRLKNIIFFVK